MPSPSSPGRQHRHSLTPKGALIAGAIALLAVLTFPPVLSRVGQSTTTYTLFNNTRPQIPTDPETNSVELGMKFRSDADGWITAIRFYKSPTNTGVHTGSLWLANGTRLASVNFTRETSSGWQEARLLAPVRITAGRLYIVSYFAPNGQYAADPGYFRTSLRSGPLKAPRSGGMYGDNGVYKYGPATAFPTDTWQSANYYVDVRFTQSSSGAPIPGPVPPTVTFPPSTSSTTTSAPTTSTPAPTTSSPTTSTPPTTEPPTTSPPTTEPPPTGGGYQVGSGPSAMMFPKKPGLSIPESSLTKYTGPTTLDSGQILIEGKFITDSIRLPEGSTADVTIRNSRFSVDSWWGILALGGKVTIEHCLFDGTGVSDINFPLGLGGDKSVVRFTEFRNNTDNIRMGPLNTAEWNYIHSPKRNTSSGIAHSDGIEVYDAPRPAGWSGPHTFVLNNYIDIGGAEGATGAVNITTDFGAVDGVRVAGNTFMPGGTYSLYVRLQTTSGPIKNVEVVNNRWFFNSTNLYGGYYGTHSVQPESSITAWSGNTLQNVNGTSRSGVGL